MRIATFVLLGSVSLNAWGNSAMCGDARRQHADLLTAEQWQAVLDEKAGGDPVLEEAIAVEKVRYQERSPKSKDLIPIDWAQLRKLVLLGAVKETFEHADLTVALVTVSGRAYTSRESYAGDLGRLTDVVDPCGVYILRVLEWPPTIVGGGRDAWSALRRGRWKTVCARDACLASVAGPSTSPLGFMASVPTEPTYAGFWPRLGALLIDSLVWLPVGVLSIWVDREYRLFDVYRVIPLVVLSVLYSMFLVARYGGTPGKLALGLRITELDGLPVTARAAVVRHLPELILSTLSMVALCVPLLAMSDAQYAEVASTVGDRTRYLRANAPAWYRPVDVAGAVWVWGELIVLLTNRKRRALHDFLAGTVVVRIKRHEA